MFKTHGKSGLTAKQITVFSDDPEQPRATLVVQATLQVQLALEPQYLDFGRVRRGANPKQTVRLVGVDAAETKIVSVSAEAMRSGAHAGADPSAVVRTKAGDGDGGGSVELTVVPDAPLGPFSGIVQVVTDHPRVPRLRFRVMGDVEGSVRVQPPRVQFRIDDSRQSQTRALLVTGTGDATVDVLEVGVDDPALAASFSAVSPGRTRIDLALNGQVEPPRRSATLRIRTSSAEDPLLEVPVDLIVAMPMRRPAKRAPVDR